MGMTAVIDTADWLLAVPVRAADGSDVDFGGTPLSIDFRPINGGPIVCSASTENGTLAFVAAATMPAADAYFRIDLRVAARTWTVAAPTAVYGDLKRHPDPLNPQSEEWLGRVALTVHPGTDSAGIGGVASTPVLLPVQPYGRAVGAPLTVGAQGAPGAPRYQDLTASGGALVLDLSLGAYVRVALNADAALTLTGWPEPPELGRLTVEIDIAPGAEVTAWPPGTLWSAGAPPLLSPGPAKDLLLFTSVDQGQTVFGQVIGQNYKPAP